jgi:hypothetical protein
VKKKKMLEEEKQREDEYNQKQAYLKQAPA